MGTAKFIFVNPTFSSEMRKELITKGHRRLNFISYLLLCWRLTGSFWDKLLRNLYTFLSVKVFIILGHYEISQVPFSAAQAASGQSTGEGTRCSGYNVILYFCCTMRWLELEGLGLSPQTLREAAPAEPLLTKPHICTRTCQGYQPTPLWPSNAVVVLLRGTWPGLG